MNNYQNFVDEQKRLDWATEGVPESDEPICKICEENLATHCVSEVTGEPQYCRQCYKSTIKR